MQCKREELTIKTYKKQKTKHKHHYKHKYYLSLRCFSRDVTLLQICALSIYKNQNVINFMNHTQIKFVKQTSYNYNKAVKFVTIWKISKSGEIQIQHHSLIKRCTDQRFESCKASYL